jgi:hypothetical protein
MRFREVYNPAFRIVPHFHRPREFSVVFLGKSFEGRCGLCGHRIVKRQGGRWKLLTRSALA